MGARKGALRNSAMKSFWITVPLKRTYAEQFGLQADVVEEWLQSKLEHLTSLFDGNGRVRARKVDEVRFDVELNFVVKGQSRLDVVDRFRCDIHALDSLACGIEIRDAASFKLCMPTIEGEMLEPFFVRVDPETGMYRDTED